MGLNITHGAWTKQDRAWTGGYRAFNEWRWMLAEIGQFESTGSERGESERGESERGEPEKGLDSLRGDWDECPNDPLEIIMEHSDCDGHINARDALPLAVRLRQVLDHGSGFTLRMPMGWSLREFVRVTEAFADALDRAHDAGERLEFH